MTLEQTIQESQNWLENYQATKRAELHRLQSQLTTLEARRTEMTERVSRDNADMGSQANLERIEQEIEAIKEQIGELRQDFRNTMMRKRSQLNDALNRQIAELEDGVTQRRSEKERIRTELLPGLERRREELIERQHQLEAEIRRMVDRVNELNRFNVESEDLELD